MTSPRRPFYVTLISNASKTIYPENLPQSFKVDLSSPITLDGRWELALSEVQYPNNWYNVNESTEFTVTIFKNTAALSTRATESPTSDDEVVVDAPFDRNPRSLVNEAVRIGNKIFIYDDEWPYGLIEEIVVDNWAVPVRVNRLRSEDAGEQSHQSDDAGSTRATREGQEVASGDDASAGAGQEGSASRRRPALSTIAAPASTAAGEVSRREEVPKQTMCQRYNEVETHITYCFTFPKGQYETVSQLCEVLTRYAAKRLKELQLLNGTTKEKMIKEPPIIFSYDEAENRVVIMSPFSKSTLTYPSHGYLPFALGLPTDKKSTVTRNVLPMTGSETPSLTQNYPALFIYCNVVEYQMIGDVVAPLLRTVSIRDPTTKIVSETFYRPYYHEVNRKYIKTLEIRICNDAGEPIIFQKGKTILVLHFRPIGFV